MTALCLMYYLGFLFIVYVVADCTASAAYVEFLEKRSKIRMDRMFSSLEKIIITSIRLKLKVSHA